MKRKTFPVSFPIIIALLIISSTSCVTWDKLRHFTDMESLEGPISHPREQKTIQAYDKLYIKILSIDEEQNRLYDANQGNAGLPVLITYLVDNDGYIDFPFVGKINVWGMSINQASVKIQAALSAYVKNPYIIVRFTENEITILGQVDHPGVYQFNQDKLNIYQALALGGGITQHGDRKSVVLIRQVGDKIVHNRLNLNDSKIANKEHFFILPNDIIVVEPLRSMAWSFNSTTFTTVLTSITTFIALYVVIFPRNR